MDYRFHFHITGKGNIDKESILAMCDLVLTERVAEFKNMCIGYEEPGSVYESYDPVRFRNHLLNTFPTSAFLFSTLDKYWLSDFETGISTSEKYTTIHMKINQPDFIHSQKLGRMFALFMRLVKLMPGLSKASIGPDNTYDFFKSKKIKQVGPPHGNYIMWITIVPPEEYKEHYTINELLEAPAYKTEEWADGLVFMNAYGDDPFSYSQPAVLEKVKLLSEYMRKTRRNIEIL